MIYLIGMITGIVSGFFGTGGGLILHPALKKVAKLEEYQARGTTLITVFPAVLIASIFYASFHYFDWQIAIRVMIGGSIGGVIGAKYMKRISPFWLTLLFNIFLIIASIKMIIQG